MKTKISHTPGPWTASTRCIWGPHQESVAVFKTGLNDNEAEANGRLIAAAPDMLHVLELIRAWLEMDPHRNAEMRGRMWRRVREVLIAARGED